MDLYTKAMAIPGMIEPVEQKSLFECVKGLKLDKNDCLIEFGSFFGRSTFCISEGAHKNPSLNKSNKLYAYDSFECHLEGGFYEILISEVKRNKLENYITKKGQFIDFSNVFSFYLKDYIKNDFIKVVKCDLNNSLPPENKKVSFLHIDSPKFHEELKVIFEKFFPILKNDAIVIFQDYFYHWSATIIASIQFLIMEGVLQIQNSAASSLITKQKQTIGIKIIESLNEKMESIDFIIEMLDKAILNINNYKIDRPNMFVPRLLLARFQFLWENKLYDKASNFLFNNVQKNKHLLNNVVIRDFQEMMAKGFSIRENYEKDYVNKTN